MRWLIPFLIFFTPLFPKAGSGDNDPLYLSLNIDSGARLKLSNGSTYQVAPADRLYSAYWITPFPIMLSESGDPNYPIKITNMNSGTFVRAKQLLITEIIEEKKRRQKEDLQPKRGEKEKQALKRRPSNGSKPQVKPSQTNDLSEACPIKALISRGHT